MPANLTEELRELVRQEAERYSEDLRSEIEQLKQRVSELESPQPKEAVKTRAPDGTRGDSYTALVPMGEEDRIALMEKVEKIEDERGLPESLYNYCIETLTASADPWRDPALRYLLLFFTVQQTFLISFTQSLTATQFHQHFKAEDAPPQDFTFCVYRTASFWETPLLYWIACMVAILLVASVIKSDDQDSLDTMYPSREKNFSIWLFGLFSWFLNSIFTPGVFAIESVGLFIGSSNSLEVVTNTLAVTFIMDLDNMLYVYLLDEEDKCRYQEHKSGRQRNPHKSWCAWSMFAANLTFMVFIMFYLKFIDRFDGMRFLRLEMSGFTVYVLICGLRGALQMTMFHATTAAEDAKTKYKRILSHSLSFFPLGICGALLYACGWCFWTFEWPTPDIMLKCFG